MIGLKLLVVVMWLLAAAPSLAAGTSGAIAQGFGADTSRGDIVRGAIVSFKSGSSATVELATTGAASHIAGVADTSPLVAISGAGTDVQVVISGTTNVLVSDINGPVVAGSKITTSPIAGVGMLATSDADIVGGATAGLDLKAAKSRSISDSRGVSRSVHIGSVPLQVGVAFYHAPGSSLLPPFIQNLANSIAGRSVSVIRILVSCFFLLLALVSVTTLIYTSVRSAITSIGRNPLAASAIRRGLYQVMALAAGILAAALVASYLILTL